MRTGATSTAAAVLATLAVGGGVAAAGYHDHGYPGRDQDTSRPSKPQDDGKGTQTWKLTRTAWNAYLTGRAEVDENGDRSAGDLDAAGAASFLQADPGTLCYGFSVKGAVAPTAVHIHRGRAGSNGPVVIEFSNLPQNADGQPSGSPGASSGCKPLTATEARALAAIRRQSRRLTRAKGRRGMVLPYYVNIHTDEHPAGAIRGQLAPISFDNGR